MYSFVTYIIDGILQTEEDVSFEILEFYLEHLTIECGCDVVIFVTP